jgi:hypothetical protein
MRGCGRRSQARWIRSADGKEGIEVTSLGPFFLKRWRSRRASEIHGFPKIIVG